MHQSKLGFDEGMLFVMPYSGFHRFWMKNTPISLDLIFIGEDLKIKGIIERTIPESNEPLGIDEPSRYVLEVRAGFAQRFGIKEGDEVKFLKIEVQK